MQATSVDTLLDTTSISANTTSISAIDFTTPASVIDGRFSQLLYRHRSTGFGASVVGPFFVGCAHHFYADVVDEVVDPLLLRHVSSAQLE